MKSSFRIHPLLAAGIFLILASQFLSAAAGPKFGPRWNSLIGEWKAEGGPGSGICGFHFDLANHVIVRTNHAELSAGSPAHEDLVIISPEAAPDKAKAVYFDNEGHTIDYTAEWSADGNTLTFNSKPGAGPQFRLIYKKVEPEVLSVAFEMTAPGQPGVFKPYTSGKVRRSGK
jgi:hypothetical protein